MSRQADVASASERVNVEEVALVHILTGAVQVQPWPLSLQVPAGLGWNKRHNWIELSQNFFAEGETELWEKAGSEHPGAVG